MTNILRCLNEYRRVFSGALYLPQLPMRAPTFFNEITVIAVLANPQEIVQSVGWIADLLKSIIQRL